MRQTGEPVLPPLLLRSVQEPPLRIATPWFDAAVFLGIRLDLRALLGLLQRAPVSDLLGAWPSFDLHFTLP